MCKLNRANNNKKKKRAPPVAVDATKKNSMKQL